MGINPIDIEPEVARQFNLSVRQGIIVVEVGPGTPAERAGIRQGDVITRIDDVVIVNSGDLRRLLRARRGGDTVLVQGIHLASGSAYTARVTLAEVAVQ